MQQMIREHHELQWGHGDEAVEEPPHFGPRPDQLRRFNGATAMKPWKRTVWLHGHPAGSSFNGATAMKPWKRVGMMAWTWLFA